MSDNSILPFIVCSSCGSIIGHKYLAHVENITNGVSQLDSFECLNVPSYCCRMLFANPIVTCNNHDVEKVKVKHQNEMKDSKEDDDLIFFERKGNYLCNLTEAPLVGDERTESMDKESLVSKINLALKEKREYRPMQTKTIDLSSIDEGHNSINLGSSSCIRKVHKIYTAFEYE